jgi:hypothetical protein
MNEPETIRKIYEMKTIAVVGLSPKPERPSHYVAKYLQEQGYRIIPVNPGHDDLLGETSYAVLRDILSRWMCGRIPPSGTCGFHRRCRYRDWCQGSLGYRMVC